MSKLRKIRPPVLLEQKQQGKRGEENNFIVIVSLSLKERFVANSDGVEGNCMGCTKLMAHDISDPVTGERLPYLIDSPAKTEKIVLKWGRVVPDRLKPTYRVAVSCTDLTESDWAKTESANGKYCAEVLDGIYSKLNIQNMI